MKKLVILSACALMFVSSFCYAASMQSLNKKQLTQALEDKTITTISLVTLNGNIINNSASIYFSKNNKTDGTMSSKPGNNPQSDEGIWSVKSNGALCITWQHWNDNKPICVFGYQLTNALVLVNTETKNLETLILNINIQSGNSVKTN